MSVCVACYETPLGRCPCAHHKGTCPHPIMHPDFARESFKGEAGHLGRAAVDCGGVPEPKKGR